MRFAGTSLHLSVATFAALAALTAACSGTAAPAVQSGATQSAPTVAAAATRVAPTISAAETQSAPTISAASTQLAPTAQALSAQLAPNANAAATQVGNAAAAVPVRIASVTPSSTDTTITLQNTSSSSMDLNGWSLHVGSTAVQLSGVTAVAPGQTLTLHTAQGTTSGANVYLGQNAQALTAAAKPGAQVQLDNPSNAVVSQFVIPGA